ncbi:MAG: hypothetical protein ACRDCE_20425 [Cetobacterium sp.]|uniref:hypothetical protein n=1 Tax=Cetobacterium sp. TaxID=2071632 RepID=UPI003EE4F406
MNRELGEIFKALKANALEINDCILISRFEPFVDCGCSCGNCPLFQGNGFNYMKTIFATIGVLNEPRTDRDS